MAQDDPGPEDDAGLPWVLCAPDPIMCAMLAAGPLPLPAIVAAWRHAAAQIETDEPCPTPADLRASLDRLVTAGYFSATSGEFALTAVGTEFNRRIGDVHQVLGENGPGDRASE